MAPPSLETRSQDPADLFRCPAVAEGKPGLDFKLPWLGCQSGALEYYLVMISINMAGQRCYLIEEKISRRHGEKNILKINFKKSGPGNNITPGGVYMAQG
jgi:hypothetical protein